MIGESKLVGFVSFHDLSVVCPLFYTVSIIRNSKKQYIMIYFFAVPNIKGRKFCPPLYIIPDHTNSSAFAYNPIIVFMPITYTPGKNPSILVKITAYSISLIKKVFFFIFPLRSFLLYKN